MTAPRDCTTHPPSFSCLDGVRSKPDKSIIEPNGAQTLSQRISTSPADIKWAVQRFATQDEGQTVATAIRHGHAIAVSDGSYKDSFGTTAFVLEGETSANRVVAVNIVLGAPE